MEVTTTTKRGYWVMNGEPHTHTPVVYVDNDGDIYIKYGDQPRHYVYRYWPGWRSRVNRVLRRQIRHHDRHSLKASRKVSTVGTVLNKYPLTERSGYWGSEIIKQKTG